MGEVYRARDPRLGREVAVKVLPDELARPDRLRRFEQEARAAGALNHSNILTIHDVGSDEGRPYLVTELLEGRTLREDMAGSPLPVSDAIVYAVQIAGGLSAAHRKGIIHRDLKPENLFITVDGVVKILDFGLAKVIAPERPVLESVTTETKGLETQAGAVMGTLGYMSPEQARGEVVDHRTDLFSLGVVIYEMVAGRRPFAGGTAADTITAILTHDPPGLAQITSDVPAALEGTVRRCLEKRRDDRFGQARDVAAALESPSGAPETPLPSGARSRRWLLAGAGLVLVAALAGVWSWRTEPGPASPSGAVQSLAVLPLENLSGDPSLEYFADGMTEALITDLGQIEALRVVSRTSVMRYKDSGKSAPEIAGELGVDALVEGSVLSSGGRVRITAQLIDGATDEHLWADSYDRELEDVLTLQSEVARQIAREVDSNLSPAEEERLTRRREVSPEAYDAYLRGDYRLYRDTPASADAMVASLQRAIELDPGFAPAYARLADFYGFLSMRGLMDPAESYLEARRLAGKAVELDPELAEARAVLARILFQFEWSWAPAEREFSEALDRNPNDVPTLALYAAYQVLVHTRCDEGLDALKRAVERDPFNYSTVLDLGVYSFHCRRYDDSIRHTERGLELKPGLALLEQILAWNYSFAGRHGEARSLCQGLLNRLAGEFDPMVLMTCGTASGLAGREKEARGFLERLKTPPDGIEVDPSWAAFVCAAIGDDECALEDLESAYRERSSNMVFLRTAPVLDPLRGHPRFQALLERMGFPPE
jgi:serine/threonine-protein kinase